MNSNQLGWTAFLVAIASVASSPAEAAVVNNKVSSQSGTIESRIARIHSTISNKADSANPLGSVAPSPEVPPQVAIGWGNG
ncbi:rSAM-associated Gly-rich repeat protein, partial [Synechocystis salina LEGE 00031]|nr:rSAM-associated Gly-rich repeat protein [Synechocystis salina LEGE 00031]